MHLVLRRPALLVTGAVTVGLLAVPVSPAFADTVSLPPHANTVTASNAKINELKLAGGVLYYEDDRASTATTAIRTLFQRTATQSAGTVALGTESTLATNVGSFMSASGDRYAFSNAANTLLTLRGPNARTLALDPTTTTDVKLSGSSLLVSTTTGDRLTDLVTGATRSLPVDTNLFGRYAVWFNADGSVDRRDLPTGTTLRVRPAGPPSSCSLALTTCTVANSKASAKAWGSYVLWRFDNETQWVDTSVSTTSHALATSKSTSLGNGQAVARDTLANLIQQNLTVSPVTTSTIAANTSKKVSYDDRMVAWSDATTNVISVASIAPAGPGGSGRLMAVDAAPALSRNGDGRRARSSSPWARARGAGAWPLRATPRPGAGPPPPSRSR